MSEQKPIIILAGLQSDGATYRLDPLSQRRLRETFPDVPTAPSIFVGFETRADFESLHGPMWDYVVILLTGLTRKRVEALGPVIVRLPATGQEFVVKERHVEDAEPVPGLSGSNMGHV